MRLRRSFLLWSVLPLAACASIAGLDDYAGGELVGTGGVLVGGGGGAGAMGGSGGIGGGQGGAAQGGAPPTCRPWGESFHAQGGVVPTVDITAIAPLPDCGAIIVVTSGAAIEGLAGEDQVPLLGYYSVVIRVDGAGNHLWETAFYSTMYSSVVHDVAVVGDEVMLAGEIVGEMRQVLGGIDSMVADVGHDGFLLNLELASGNVTDTLFTEGGTSASFDALHADADGVTIAGWFQGPLIISGNSFETCDEGICGLVLRRGSGGIDTQKLETIGNSNDGVLVLRHIDVDDTGDIVVGGRFNDGSFNNVQTFNPSVAIAYLTSDLTVQWRQTAHGVGAQRLAGLAFAGGAGTRRVDALIDWQGQVVVAPLIDTMGSEGTLLASLPIPTGTGRIYEIPNTIHATSQFPKRQLRHLSANELLLGATADGSIDFDIDGDNDVENASSANRGFWAHLGWTLADGVTDAPDAFTFPNDTPGVPNSTWTFHVAGGPGVIFAGGQYAGAGNPVDTEPAGDEPDAWVSMQLHEPR